MKMQLWDQFMHLYILSHYELPKHGLLRSNKEKQKTIELNTDDEKF